MSFAGEADGLSKTALRTLHFAFLGVIFAGERGPDLHEVSGLSALGVPPWRTK